ncbi:MAG TPA: hypothetical protein V6C99_11965 [Oculatellaceae cyanobacterium]
MRVNSGVYEAQDSGLIDPVYKKKEVRVGALQAKQRKTPSMLVRVLTSPALSPKKWLACLPEQLVWK